MEWGQGAGLTTTQVATVEAYWKFLLTHQWAIAHETDPTGGILGALIERQASQDSTWLICDSCAQILGIDPKQYRIYNHQGSKPPGIGPAEEEKVALVAMFAWTQLYESWPTGVQLRDTPPPPTGMVCDFCRRQMYPDEHMALIKPDAVEAFEKSGALRRRGRPGNLTAGMRMDVWVACPFCIARAIQKGKATP
jgi:hypothetical protein